MITCTVYSVKRKEECGNPAVCTLTSPTGLNQGAACSGHMLFISNSIHFKGEKSPWFGWNWERIKKEATFDSLTNKIWAILPNATIGDDNEGQIIVYTNWKMVGPNKIIEMG